MTTLPTNATNTAITTNPSHELRITSPPVPSPAAGECLIHVRATGICGSDVHFWKKGGIGSSHVTGELGLGHESAGVVVKIGEGVEEWKVGDRVALENGIPCSLPSCTPCRTGQYHACPDMVFFSSPPVHGTLRRYHAHPAAWLHRLPDSMSFEEGALLEPLSVALAGIERAGLRLGDSLVICGAGPIGLVSLLAAHAAGAAPIVITDLDESRLEMAKRLVPRATRFGGSVFIIGVGKSFQTIPFMHASFREIDIRFQFRYHETYPKAINLVSEGLIDLKSLVTHRFTLEQAREAFEAASTASAKAVKVQLLDG
ncbi:hypothetical protein Q7P37_010560 [Cladosporium fusiforme]